MIDFTCLRREEKQKKNKQQQQQQKFGPFSAISVKHGKNGAAQIFCWPFLSYAAEFLASWQQW
jgi:hypothetical protein